jgi:hypothetical protein
MGNRQFCAFLSSARRTGDIMISGTRQFRAYAEATHYGTM